jgi:multiple sugar transport system permease protein
MRDWFVVSSCAPMGLLRSVKQETITSTRAPGTGIVSSIADVLGKYVLLAAFTVLLAFPFIWLVRSALMTNAQMFHLPVEWIPNPWRFNNFVGALTSRPFVEYFRNTMLIELCVVPGVLVSSSLAAFAFSRLRWPGRDLVFFILLTALMVPYVVVLIPTFLMWRTVGAIGTYVPLIVPAWLGGGAFNIFLLRQFFLTIPRDIDEAAYLDGANPLQVLWHILLPLSRPVLVIVAVLSFIYTWNDFIAPLIYITDPDQFTLTMGLAYFTQPDEAGGNWGYLMAASTSIILPLVAVFFVGQRYIMTGITIGGRHET